MDLMLTLAQQPGALAFFGFNFYFLSWPSRRSWGQNKSKQEGGKTQKANLFFYPQSWFFFKVVMQHEKSSKLHHPAPRNVSEALGSAPLPSPGPSPPPPRLLLNFRCPPGVGISSLNEPSLKKKEPIPRAKLMRRASRNRFVRRRRNERNYLA